MAVTLGSTEFKVGLFVVVSLVMVIGMFIYLEGNPFVNKSHNFYTILEDVGGIGNRTQVRTSGVEVGAVTSIDVLKVGARVNFQVRADIVITKGSVIELKTRGFLGDVYIEIKRNIANNVPIKDDSHIKMVSERNDFTSLMGLAGNIARDLQTVSKALSSVFGTKDGEATLSSIIKNINDISQETKYILSDNRKQIQHLISNLDRSSILLVNLIDKNGNKVTETMNIVSLVAKDLRNFSSDLKNLLKETDLKKIRNIISSIDSTMENIQYTTTKVQLMVDKVQRGEGSLGQIVSSDDTVNELKTTIKSVQKLIEPVKNLRVELDYKGEFRTKTVAELNTMGNHINIRLNTNVDKYYLLGISDSLGAKKLTETTTNISNINGQTTTTTELTNTPEDRPALRFNAQFAKRFSLIGLRFGLFESYAGFATDLYLLSDKFIASLEAFNFGSTKSTNVNVSATGLVRLKVYGNYFLTDNIYLTGGADNIGKNTGVFGFFGAGFRFTDDDLKSVIGIASLVKP